MNGRGIARFLICVMGVLLVVEAFSIAYMINSGSFSFSTVLLACSLVCSHVGLLFHFMTRFF